MGLIENIIAHNAKVDDDKLLLFENDEWFSTEFFVIDSGYYNLFFNYEHYDYEQRLLLKIIYDDGKEIEYTSLLPGDRQIFNTIVKFKKGINKMTVYKVYGHELIFKNIEISERLFGLESEITPKSDYFYLNESNPIKIMLKAYENSVSKILCDQYEIPFTFEFRDFSDSIDPFYSGDADIRKYIVISAESLKMLSCGDYKLQIIMDNNQVHYFYLTVKEKREESPLKIVSLDVSHGNATFIHFPNGKTLLVDSGDERRSRDIVFSYIKKNNLTVDYYLLTHFHGDHNGMIDEILENNAIKMPDLNICGENICASKEKRIEYLSNFRYLDSTMLSRYDEIHKIWDLGGVELTALNSRFSEDGLPIDIYINPNIRYNRYKYENATSVSFLLRFNGFGYYHGSDCYSYIQQENMEYFKSIGKDEELKCEYFYANHHFHYDLNEDFIRYVNPVAVYVPANQAIYARTVFAVDYATKILNSEYPQKRLKDTLISHETGTVAVRVFDKQNWYYCTENIFL